MQNFTNHPLGVQLRAACEADAPALLEIYAPYVRQTAITFEYDVPSVAEFAQRIRTTLRKFPYLVAWREGEILGYAYAGVFHGRPAYDWAVETSLYVAQSHQKLGLGRFLHDGLQAALQAQGILNMEACIACPCGAADPYLTDNSRRFHAHLGYREVGEFQKCGYKFGRWYNMVWMEKHIGAHLDAQPPIRPFAEVRQQLRERYGIL